MQLEELGTQAAQQVLQRLLAAHEAYFDVYRDYEYAGRRFPGYAEFASHGQKYFLSKKATLWEVDSFEYLFFDTLDTLDAETAQAYFDFLGTQAINKIQPDPNHMTSYLSVVLVANRVAPDAAKRIKKMRFHKEFKMGLRGWADGRIAVADLSCMRIVANPMGKVIAPTLAANAGFPTGRKKRFWEVA